MNDLEQRLHDALDAEARRVPVSSDAWQVNARRLANRRRLTRAQRGRVATIAAVAAGVVAFVAPSVPPLRGVFDDTGSDGRPQLVQDGKVGRTVRLAEVTRSGKTAPYEAYLNADRGDVQFCEGYSIGPTHYGSCVISDSGDEGVKPGVVPYLVQRIRDDDSQEGFAGAVTRRVNRVQAWRVDGSRTSLRLQDLDFDGLKAFGFYRPRGQRPVQRVVFLGADGRVLHSVDIALLLYSPRDCRGMTPTTPLPGTASVAAVRPAELSVEVNGTAQVRTVCTELGATLAGVKDETGAVLALAPEVDSVHVRHADGSQEVLAGEPVSSATIWRLLAVPRSVGLTDADTLVAYDARSRIIQAVPVSSLP